VSSKAPQSAESYRCARFHSPRDVRSHSPRMSDNSALDRASRVCGARLVGSLCEWREFTCRQRGPVRSRNGRGTRSPARGGRRPADTHGDDNGRPVPPCLAQTRLVVLAIKGGEAVLAKVRERRASRGRPSVKKARPGRLGARWPYGVWSPRAGRSRAATGRPVTSRSSCALTEVAPFRRECDRNASCASADISCPGARTPSTCRGVYQTTYRLGMSCEASPQISAPALVRTHQRQLTGTCKLFGMARNRNTGALRLVVIT
jgi:hypothetical protein